MASGSKVRHVDFAEVRDAKRAVGSAGVVRPWPFHVYYDRFVAAGGTPSPEFKRAADAAREFYRTVD